MKLFLAKRSVAGLVLAIIVATFCGSQSAKEAPTAKAPTAKAPTAKAPTAEAPTAKAPTAEAQTAEAQTKEAPVQDNALWLPIKRFVGDFESGNLAAWSAREAARPDSVEIVARPTRRGRHAARFTVRPGERVSNGNRAEITHDNGDAPGHEGWCAWSFQVPIEYSNTEWKPRLWQCLGQWHDQPNPTRGETWDTFPGHSPSVAVYYLFQKGVPKIELWYGPYPKGAIQKIIASAPIRLGKWNDLVFHIGWSNHDNGFIEAWLNGKPLTPFNGRDHKVAGANMWNDYAHYLKIGLYRSSDFTTTNSVYFDEVRIGNSLGEVAPGSKHRLK